MKTMTSTELQDLESIKLLHRIEVRLMEQTDNLFKIKFRSKSYLPGVRAVFGALNDVRELQAPILDKYFVTK